MNSPLTELGLLNPSLKECEDRAKILAKFAMCLFAKTCGKNPELNHPQAALHGMYDKVKKCLYMQFPGRSQIQLSGKKMQRTNHCVLFSHIFEWSEFE